MMLLMIIVQGNYTHHIITVITVNCFTFFYKDRCNLRCKGNMTIFLYFQSVINRLYQYIFDQLENFLSLLISITLRNYVKYIQSSDSDENKLYMRQYLKSKRSIIIILNMICDSFCQISDSLNRVFILFIHKLQLKIYNKASSIDIKLQKLI